MIASKYLLKFGIQFDRVKLKKQKVITIVITTNHALINALSITNCQTWLKTSSRVQLDVSIITAS